MIFQIFAFFGRVASSTGTFERRGALRAPPAARGGIPQTLCVIGAPIAAAGSARAGGAALGSYKQSKWGGTPTPNGHYLHVWLALLLGFSRHPQVPNFWVLIARPCPPGSRPISTPWTRFRRQTGRWRTLFRPSQHPNTGRDGTDTGRAGRFLAVGSTPAR